MHASRLRNILENVAGEADPAKCKVLSALMDESEDLVQSCSHNIVRDAALIAGAQEIEHYEIASYGVVRHFAQVLGRDADTEALDPTIHEEGHADQLLTTASFIHSFKEAERGLKPHTALRPLRS